MTCTSEGLVIASSESYALLNKWGIPRPYYEARPLIFLQAPSLGLPFSATEQRQGTMSFLQLAHKSLAAPAANPVARLYRSVNK